MNEAPFSLDFDDEDETFTLKDTVFKYLRYWPWFLLCTILCLGLGYVYMRYVPIMYESVAKIELVDESKEIDIAKDPLSILNGNSKINLDNDIEVLKSYRILNQVVEALNLDISYYNKGNIKTTEIWNPPFAITKLMAEDSVKITKTFDIVLNDTEALITNEQGKITTVNFKSQDTIAYNLPFNINIRENAQPEAYEGINFRVTLRPIKQSVLELTWAVQVQATNKNSEILSISLKGQSPARSETIINELINKFNQDGISDRQLVSKRTLDFIDDRFAYLSNELDSIEVGKEDFKRLNNLSYIESDAGISLQRKTVSADEASKLDTQVEISVLLKNAVIGQSEYNLLPVDIGLDNSGVNTLVSDYNKMAIERDKLMTSVGENHPTLVSLSSQLERSKVNILKTLNVYQTQLKLSLRQLNREKSQAGISFARLPEKEKMLRSIERQQSIKENLFLLLLQKREEAAISYAVTAPSIKVVDYAVTTDDPISPKGKIVYSLTFLLGLFIPFIVLFLRFTMDSKIYNRSDIEKLNTGIPIIAEIPFLKGNKSFKGTTDRSILAESFRISCTNVNYLLPKKEAGQGQVIFVTSAIKGEGKTLMAFNLSLAYASMKKRVLLIGADLRNPALNDHFDSKKTKGLSDYLNDPTMNWKYCINDGFNANDYHKICFSGAIPPNAAELLSDTGFGKFIEKAQTEFDYIIVDTAPTLLVTDTMLISQYADLTLFVTRAGFTDKRLIEYSKGLNNSKKLYNMAYVLNDVVLGKTKGYNYGHEYGYGNQKP